MQVEVLLPVLLLGTRAEYDRALALTVPDQLAALQAASLTAAGVSDGDPWRAGKNSCALPKSRSHNVLSRKIVLSLAAIAGTTAATAITGTDHAAVFKCGATTDLRIPHSATRTDCA